MAREGNSIFDTDLGRRGANYTPLSPLSFIRRTARAFPDHLSVIHGDQTFTWRETYVRSLRLASALAARGVGAGDTVAILCPNTPPMVEAHFGVPMTGAVLNTLNTRLDPATLAFILDHGEAKVLLTDTEYSGAVRDALAQLEKQPLVIDIDDPQGPGGEPLGNTHYEALLGEGTEDYEWSLPDDEWRAISLNYTSGTTGNPKGVVYHHRGAYLNALGNAVGWDMGHHPVYLWTLPMFHCNGWCFPWTLAALAGTNVCTRRVSAATIFAAIETHGVTHFCGAPIVLNFVINATDEERRDLPHPVQVMTAAAPPPASVLSAMEARGFRMTHVYGLTETYGPAVVCAWHKDWDQLDDDEKSQKKARQGVPYHVLEDIDIIDPETMQSVPPNGEVMGEAMFRGNVVMKGYLKNPAATEEAFAGGWFHSGDLGVMDSDQYIRLKDRSKDVIISGGENISSIEVENVLYRHPAVLEAAVVARPDDKWGETPCAFVALKESAEATTESEIIDFCRENMARYKVPRTVLFGPLPKTSTGKIQKFKLREQTDKLGSLN